MSLSGHLKQKLYAAFDPVELVITNESHKHQGHAGDDGSGESHFRVSIVSNAFEGLGRVERHRLVYDALGAEFAGSLHALALVTKTPAEAEI